MRILCAIVLLMSVSGCELSPEQMAEYQTQRQRAVDVRNATTQKIADLEQASADVKAELANLPANDPVRPMVERSVKSLDSLVEQAKKSIAVTDRVIAGIDAATSGDVSGVGEAIRDIPVVGPYAGLIVLLMGLGKKWYDDSQKKKVITDQQVKLDELDAIARQLVKSVEVAMPVKTESDKLKLAAVQDTTTKQFVDAVKSNP